MNSVTPLAGAEETKAAKDRLSLFFLMAVVTWCALPLSPPHADSDFWGHVQYGLDVWHAGLDTTATYTYNALGHRWINHENLSELAFAALTRSGNGGYLLILKCLMGVVVLTLGVAHGRRSGAGALAIATCLVVAAVNLSFYWGVRPHLFSFFFFGLLIAILEWSFVGWSGLWHGPRANKATAVTADDGFDPTRLRWLWLLPILLAIWTNTHGGFLAGLAVALAILLMRAFEFVFERGRKGIPTALFLLTIAGATGLATLLNPYGIGLHLWLVESLGVPRPEILEWHPPAWFGPGAGKRWALLGLVTLGLLGSRKPRDMTRVVVLALVLSQAIKHQRHLPFVAILLMFWLPAHLSSAASRLRSGSDSLELPPAFLKFAGVAMLALASLFAVRVGQRLAVIPVDRNVYPVSAVQFVADQSLTGRMVTTGQWAQYVLGVIGAKEPGDEGVQVAFDGRFRTCYPQQVVDLHFDFFIGPGGPDKRFRSPESPPVEPLRLLSHNQPNLVLINRQQTRQVVAMKAVDDDWALLYQDGLAQLWGRRSVYDDVALTTYIAPERRIVDGGLQSGFVPFPGGPRLNASPYSTQPVRAKLPTAEKGA